MQHSLYVNTKIPMQAADKLNSKKYKFFFKLAKKQEELFLLSRDKSGRVPLKFISPTAAFVETIRIFSRFRNKLISPFEIKKLWPGMRREEEKKQS